MTEPDRDGRGGLDPEDGPTADGRPSRYARPIPPPAGVGTSRAEPQKIAAHQPLLPHEPVRHAPVGPRRRAFTTVARLAGPPAALAVVATIALGVAMATLAGSRSLAVNGWLLGIGGLLIWAFWRALTSALPGASTSAFDLARDSQAEPPSKLHDVIAIEGILLDAEWSRGGVEYRLRPLLRKIAAARLIEHHQVDLATEPDAAHRIMGDELWALVGRDPYRAAESGVAGSDRRAARPASLEAADLAEAAGRVEAEAAELAEATGAATVGTETAELLEAARVEAAELAQAAQLVAAEARPAGAAPFATTTQNPTEWTQTRRGRHGIPRATIRRAIEQLEAL